MLDRQEIDIEIARLEYMDSSYPNYMKLATLYAIADHMDKSGVQPPPFGAAVFSCLRLGGKTAVFSCLCPSVGTAYFSFGGKQYSYPNFDRRYLF